MTDLRVVRIHPRYDLSWELWPEVEARVTRFSAELGFEQPTAALYQWLRQMFVSTPEILGLWVAVEGTTIRGHLLSWADAFLGEPFVFVYQCQADDRHSMETIRRVTAESLAAWIDEMNAAYEAKGVPYRIRRVRFTTARDVEAWKRYLRPFGEVERERVILSVKLRERLAPLPTMLVSQNGDA